MTFRKLGAQFTKYGGVAVVSALTDWIVFVFLEILGSGYLIAQTFARISGGVFSFVINKNWSFDQTGGHILVQGRRFLALYAFSYGLSLGLLFSLVTLLSLNPYYAKLISDITCFIVNFLAMRSYVFSGGTGFTSYISGGWKLLQNEPDENSLDTNPLKSHRSKSR